MPTEKSESYIELSEETVNNSQVDKKQTKRNTTSNRKKEVQEALDKQTEAAHSKGTIQNAILTGDMDAFIKLVEADPNVLQSVDPLGARPFHLLFLFNGPAHHAIIKWLFTTPHIHDIILHEYENVGGADVYTGETALHLGKEMLSSVVKLCGYFASLYSLVMHLLCPSHLCCYCVVSSAVVNRDLESVKMLVKTNPKLLHIQATGAFFRSGSPCYYGGCPLGFAACTNNYDIVNYLLSKGML